MSINTNVPSAIAIAPPPPPEFRASLVIRSRPPRDAIRVRQPFTIGYTLTLGPSSSSSQQQLLDLRAIEALDAAIQFLEPKRVLLESDEDAGFVGTAPLSSTSTFAIGPGSPILSTPVSARGSVGFGGGRSQITVGSPIAAFLPSSELLLDEADQSQASTYPPPHVASKESGVRHVGPSILRLPAPAVGAEDNNFACFDFDAEFVAIQRGVHALGSGLRVVDAGQRVLAEWAATGQVVVVS